MSFQQGESDFFVGRRGRLQRFLVCAMEGYTPVVAKGPDGTLAALFRVGGAHIGLSGTLALSRSTDGRVWSTPVEIAPRQQDNRNPALGFNAAGELVVAYWRAGLHRYDPDPVTGELLWNNSPPLERLEAAPALFVQSSADGGATWSQHGPLDSTQVIAPSPYGRILCAPDGTLLLAVYGAPRQGREGVNTACALLRSRDGGRSWGDESLVALGYNETAYAFTADGTLVAAARSDSGHVAILRSGDGGMTWSAPRQVTRDGEHPADLCPLADGRLLLTFGRRLRPLGAGALISRDGGESWLDEEVLLAGDGVQNGDLGYPSTVQLADGTLVTLLYYASGSEMSRPWGGWGEVSCQAIHCAASDLPA